MNVYYLVVDRKTGFVRTRMSVPDRMFPPDIEDGTCVVVASDGGRIDGQARFDMRKLRQDINTVASFDDVLAAWRPDEMPPEVEFERVREARIAELDRDFAQRIADLRGPLAAIHDEKRRQAEAGSGALVQDGAERAAILKNAAAEDAAIAGLERQRRAIKAALRAASRYDELAAVALHDATDRKAL